jgi:cytochrome c oxidase cbb3-type subunit 3
MSAEPPEIAEYERADEAARDGIREEDNRIPGWWWGGLWFTVAFAAFYIPYYLLSGWSQETQYLAEVEAAQARAAAVRASLPSANPFRGDAAAVSEGAQVFATICAACHKPDGSGLVGPSLVDPYWKYGSDDPALFETVATGRPAGMPGWASQLGNDKIWKVLAYLETLPKSAAPGVGAPGIDAAGTAAAAP